MKKTQIDLIREALPNTNGTFKETFSKFGINPKKPLGSFSPWAWAIEPVRGCNLNCWHCAAHLARPDYKFMTKETWINLWTVIAEVSPYCRVEMDNIGEPTLHPDLLEFIRIARKISPHSQIQITTNGIQLIKGKLTYKELFDAGLNVAYVDMYSKKEDHIRLAEESGYPYLDYYSDESHNSISAWVYHNDPDIKLIALALTPEFWPKKKLSRGGLGTFLDTLDFERAKKFHVLPVAGNAPERRCSQPMKYVAVDHEGTLLYCCQDMFNSQQSQYSVNYGVESFYKFWFGDYMQRTRQILDAKGRTIHPMCKNCRIIFARCDMRFWNVSSFNYSWDGDSFKPVILLPEEIYKEKNKPSVLKPLF